MHTHFHNNDNKLEMLHINFNEAVNLHCEESYKVFRFRSIHFHFLQKQNIHNNNNNSNAKFRKF